MFGRCVCLPGRHFPVFHKGACGWDERGIYSKRGMEDISLTLKPSHTTPHLSSCPNQTLSRIPPAGCVFFACPEGCGWTAGSYLQFWPLIGSGLDRRTGFWSECCTYGSNLSQHVWRGILTAPIFGLWWIELLKRSKCVEGVYSISIFCWFWSAKRVNLLPKRATVIYSVGAHTSTVVKHPV